MLLAYSTFENFGKIEIFANLQQTIFHLVCTLNVSQLKVVISALFQSFCWFIRILDVLSCSLISHARLFMLQKYVTLLVFHPGLLFRSAEYFIKIYLPCFIDNVMLSKN